MNTNDKLRDKHAEALSDLRNGVEMDAAHDPQGADKLAALDYAIAALSALPAAGVAVLYCRMKDGKWELPGIKPEEYAFLCEHGMGKGFVPFVPATTPQPSAAEGGEERARKLYEPDEYEDAFKGRKDAAVGAQGDGYPNTSDVPDSELREQLSACRDDWQRLCDAVEPGQHFDPDALIRHLAAPAAGEGVDVLPTKWRGFADALDRKGDLTFGQICMRDAVRDCADELEAALTRQPVAGDGMVLVPREPSPEQVRAGTLAGILTPNQASAAYQAMLAAAPAATPTCAHEWVSGDNKYVSNTLICQRCYEIKPAATPTDGGEGS